jgi:uncharacterized protein (TIGR03663 family)
VSSSRDDGRADDRRRVLWALLALCAAASVLRVVLLGDRVAHWDEGRVAYWALRYAETGVWSYRPIVHGPLLFHVERVVFEHVGTSDAAMRLPVAIVGGLAPLSAWLYRGRLTDGETIAMGALLAINPLFLYYSRFMRNDVIVAVFALVAFGLLLRAADAGRGRYLLAGVVAFVLAASAKENAWLYPLCWIGAGTLAAAGPLWRRARRRGAVRDEPRLVALVETTAPRFRAASRSLRDLAGALVLAPVTFIVLLAWFYAPRPLAADWPLDPAVWNEALVGSAGKVYRLWISGAAGGEYATYLAFFGLVALVGGTAICAFGVAGVVTERRARRRSRWLVWTAGLWALVSLLGYPIAADIRAPWLVVHVLAPLSIPAAVGLAACFRRAKGSIPPGARIGRRGASLAFVLAIATALAVGGVTSYVHPTTPGNVLVQWAQPGEELRPGIERAETVARHHDGVDVHFVGTDRPGRDGALYVANESSLRQPPPGGPGWHARLPLPWYFERSKATVRSAPPGNWSAFEDPPPVVVAYEWDRERVAANLTGYVVTTGRFKVLGENVTLRAFNRSATYEGERLSIFVDRSVLEAARAAE